MEGSKAIGYKGEAIASDYLETLGYQIKKRNFTIRDGELDIIALTPENVLVFVEVKAYKPDSYYSPLESITRSKIRHLKRAIMVYISRFQVRNQIRVDLITVENEKVKDHLENIILFN